MDILLERKSVRQYKPEDVKEEDLNYILRAAMSAPTAANHRTWQFIVVKDKTMHKKISEIHPYAQFILNAPLAIIVVGDEEAALGGIGGYFPQDCAAATENILLASFAKGYGAVWCGIYSDIQRQKDFEKLFNLPKNITAFSLVVIGKSADNNPPKDGWDPSKIKYETWK
ncbi:MAG: nitroreductase family protein [Elusimicrobiota bacterium]|jgi:nitroreductase|nr:nitroreductase family protein [Elusimicrobiota bacterium]